MDTVEASELDGCWLKVISLSLCLLDFTVHGRARHASLKSRPSCQRPMGRGLQPVLEPHWLGCIRRGVSVVVMVVTHDSLCTQSPSNFFTSSF